MSSQTAIIYEQRPTLSKVLSGALGRGGFGSVCVQDPIRLLSVLKAGRPDLVILGACAINPQQTLELVMQVRQVAGNIPIVFVVAESSEELAIAALRAGVNEYVTSPLVPEALTSFLDRSFGKRAHSREASADGAGRPVDRLVGDSALMRDVHTRLERASATDSNVLITGETGTGKDLVAQEVHRRSPRSDKPLATINCAAIPDSIFESELFGYERGAFTGAEQRQEGRLKAADGGTVFFDEIGDMSMYGQAKVLRMMESHEIQRLGKNSGIPVDVRIIAATNHNLEQLTEQGTFRRDLFFRLAVATLHLPPLRERKEDLPALIAYYINYFNYRFGRSVRTLSHEAMELLFAYDWPGNVRELRNLLELVFIDLPGCADTEVADLPLQFRSRYAELKHASPDERARLLSALSATNWNKSKAASQLHWSRMTLYRKMARYRIQSS
jgi:DNA-binding NtrC family response regulator